MSKFDEYKKVYKILPVKQKIKFWWKEIVLSAIFYMALIFVLTAIFGFKPVSIVLVIIIILALFGL